MILFRGVSKGFFEASEGRLVPKETGPFRKSAQYGKAEWGNAFYGHNEKNAVVEHQLHQAGYATSEISTTPHMERAKFYATHDGKFDGGLVYEIDSADCERYETQIYIVSKIVPKPTIPEDDEVILVAKEFGELPRELIRKVHEFGT